MIFFSLLAILLASKCAARDGMEVTNSTFAYAETQHMFGKFLFKLKKLYPETSGTGMFAHSPNVTDDRDTKVPRPNFDTLYSMAILDLTEPCTLTIEDTGRYQSVLIITEHHYMPTYFINTKPGTYTLTKEELGDKNVVALARTLLDKEDTEDTLKAYKTQRLLQLSQTDKGKYEPEEKWDDDSLEERRMFFTDLGARKVVASGDMFGPDDGTITEENHNIGAATGWGGNPPAMAVYENYLAKASGPYKFLLKNIPVRAFWSVTLYDYMGFVEPRNTYHIQSGFANENDDGSVIIDFVDDRGTSKFSGMNVMDTYPGWNFVLRLYEPEDVIVNGDWVRPKLDPQECLVDYSRSVCESKGCEYYKDQETKEKKCRHYLSSPKKLCETFLSEEMCNAPDKEGVCFWNSEKDRCDVFKCGMIETEEECVGECAWNDKREKCDDFDSHSDEFASSKNIDTVSEVKKVK